MVCRNYFAAKISFLAFADELGTNTEARHSERQAGTHLHSEEAKQSHNRVVTTFLVYLVVYVVVLP